MKEKSKKKNIIKRVFEWIIQGNKKAAENKKFCQS